MSESIRLSESEWKIVQLFKEKEQLATSEIVETMETEMAWKPRTTTTLLTRLLKKGVLSYEVQGRSYIYSMRIRSEICIQTENESFLNKVYNGAIRDMFASFIEQKELSSQEIDELKALLEKKRNEL